jgi:hypothetical protein
MVEVAKHREGMELNTEISIELPASVWVSYLASYLDNLDKWRSHAADLIAEAAVEAVLDPDEYQARIQEMQRRAAAHDAMERLLNGQAPVQRERPSETAPHSGPYL